MVTVLVSLASGRKVRSDVAMTGEITLRGRVMPIGGVKEKVLAAYRSGIHTVILPRKNEQDLLEDLPRELREQMEFVFVDDIKQVLDTALEGGLPSSRSESAAGAGDQDRSQDQTGPQAAAEAVVRAS
jgi:ATP-dependent Lon protease